MPGVVVSLGRPAVNYRKVGVTLETLLRYHFFNNKINKLGDNLILDAFGSCRDMLLTNP
jgi:hypothetical protein